MSQTTTQTPRAEDRSLSRLVKVEANFLRLPIFALRTQGLKTLNGIECRGIITRNGQTYRYTFQTARSTRTPYPGPLARAAHLALLSLVSERGLPLENPVAWNWRDLCRRLGTTYSGQTVRQLKAAILSTVGLLLYSQSAVYSKAEGRLLGTQEQALRLYDQVVFANEVLPDGGVSDTNLLWFSDWYLANLNSLFTAPLDYDLWQHLDKQSPIASRLYEYLLLNFYAGAPALRIGYTTLAQCLPVRPERYESQARWQLDPALKLLVGAGVLKGVRWEKSKSLVAFLHAERGGRLPMAPGREPVAAAEEEASEEILEVREIKEPVEKVLVADFYRLWRGQTQQPPTSRELTQARGLIETFGEAKAKALIPLAVQRMRQGWPDAKAFGALSRYVDEAAGDYERQQQALQWEREEKLRRQRDEVAQAAQRAREAEAAARWERLSPDERLAIEEAVIRQVPLFASKRGTSAFHVLCVAELARALQGPPPAAAG